MDRQMNRDIWIFAPFIALILVLIMMFSPGPLADTNVELWKGLVIGLIGIYGGVKGTGKKGQDPKNTLGTYSGLIRSIVTALLLCIVALYQWGWFPSVSVDMGSFLWVVMGGSAGVATPAVVRNFLQQVDND